MVVSRNSLSNNLPAQLAAFVVATVPTTQSLCVALSGGRDSVALLHALLAAGSPHSVSALHVHHGLSPHADQWAAHCQMLCAAWGVPLQLERVTVVDTGFGIEAAARDARYLAFASSPADCLLLAHHRDDQAETVLFNLLRGCGVAGARGMRGERLASGKRLLRPLLPVSAFEITEYAKAAGLSWVEDESNADVAFSRNFLRHEVMPRLETRFPAASAQLARAATHFADAEILLAELAAIDWAACADGASLRLSALRQLSSRRIRNLLRWHLQQLTWRTPSAVRMDEFVRQLLAAGPEGRPLLCLPDGEMRVCGRCLEFRVAL